MKDELSLTQQEAQKYSAVTRNQLETQINCWLKKKKKEQEQIIFEFRQKGCHHMAQIQKKAYLNPCSLSCSF